MYRSINLSDVNDIFNHSPCDICDNMIYYKVSNELFTNNAISYNSQSHDCLFCQMYYNMIFIRLGTNKFKISKQIIIPNIFVNNQTIICKIIYYKNMINVCNMYSITNGTLHQFQKKYINMLSWQVPIKRKIANYLYNILSKDIIYIILSYLQLKHDL